MSDSKVIQKVAAAKAVKNRPRFGRLPERGVGDQRLWRTRHAMHARVFYACSIHADAAGLFCISQNTVANLVGLRHGASAYSYLRDLEDWGYLRRVDTIPHPDRKFFERASSVLGRKEIKGPYLSDLIIRQVIIRPGEDEAENAARIPAQRRIDEDHPVGVTCGPHIAEIKQPRKTAQNYSHQRAVVKEVVTKDRVEVVIAPTNFEVF
jgi:hypothetical protein